MKSIAIHMSAHGRHKTAAIAYKALDRVCAQFKERGYRTKIYTAVSDAETARLAKKHKHIVVTFQNNPVGKKFDDLLKHMVRTNPDWDWLMEYGSDNVLDVDYVDRAIAAMDAGHQHICLNGFYIKNAENDEDECLLFYKPAATSNIGRLTHRSLIEATYRKHGYVYEHRLNRGLDSDSHKRVKRAGRIATHVLERNPPLLVDLKDEGSMHDYAGFARLPNKFPSVPLEGNFPELQPDNKWQLQEKSGVTQSASTSPTQASPTQEQPKADQPSAITPASKTTRSNSSRAPRAAASRAAAKSSTRRRKTTTAGAKSSRAGRAGRSAQKD